MVLLICFQNVNGATFDTAALKLSNLHRKSHTILVFILFWLDLPLFEYEKTDKELIKEFL